MIRDITIGQYYQVDSIIHRLDPRVKLLATLIYVISLFIVNSPIGYGIAVLFLIICVAMSKVPVKYVLKGLKSLVFILLFSATFIVLFTSGEHIIFKYGIIKISREGIFNAIEMVVRLTLLLIGSSVMTLTTTPTDLADGLEKAFGFLKVIKVPVHEMAMMISIAFRFIPILIEETDKIMKAQIARGADFESGGLIKKAKSLIPLLVPLLISAIKRALDLATAMEARCYNGGDGRTKMKPLKYKKCDYVAYGVQAGYLVVIIVTNIVVKMVMKSII
jgi:energy-coupling factor transport system permease protein